MRLLVCGNAGRLKADLRTEQVVAIRWRVEGPVGRAGIEVRTQVVTAAGDGIELDLVEFDYGVDDLDFP